MQDAVQLKAWVKSALSLVRGACQPHPLPAAAGPKPWLLAGCAGGRGCWSEGLSTAHACSAPPQVSAALAAAAAAVPVEAAGAGAVATPEAGVQTLSLDEP